MDKDILKIWEERLKKELSPSRLAHSQRVGRLAGETAAHWGLDSLKAHLAGLLHDIAREMPLEEYLPLAEEGGIAIGAAERASPMLLHGPIGALLLKERWGLEDADILQAIAGHTIADKEMSPYEQIVFLADIAEPGRQWSGLDELRRLMKSDLNQAMVYALEESLPWQEEKGYMLHPQALEALEYFKAMAEKKGKKEE